jgi:hypothetical protein
MYTQSQEKNDEFEFVWATNYRSDFIKKAIFCIDSLLVSLYLLPSKHDPDTKDLILQMDSCHNGLQ